MGRGDSACFYPVADSVFKFDLGIPKPDWVAAGSRLKLEVGVHRIRNEEAEITTFMGQQGLPDSCRTASGAVRWKPNAAKSSKTKTGLLQNGVKYRLVGRMQSLNGQVIRAFTDQEPYYFVQGQDQIKPEGLGDILSTCAPGIRFGLCCHHGQRTVTNRYRRWDWSPTRRSIFNYAFCPLAKGTPLSAFRA